MDDQQFRDLLEYFNLSWKGYRRVRKGVKKRVRRHMAVLGCPRMADYLERLQRDETMRTACHRLLTVSISRFFRDRLLWEVLEQQILPAVYKDGSGTGRFWCAGCGCGEEAYSLSILCHRLKRLERKTVTATDIHTGYLGRAKAGVYSESSLRDVPDSIRESLFIPLPGGGGYRVASPLREGIEWRQHDLVAEPPVEGPFDLILVRNNLLTYYRDPQKSQALSRVLEVLSAGGFLVVGSHEQLPAGRADLVPLAPLSYVFRKSPEDTGEGG